MKAAVMTEATASTVASGGLAGADVAAGRVCSVVGGLFIFLPRVAPMPAINRSRVPASAPGYASAGSVYSIDAG
jgi:hypothetical protein